MRRTKAFQAKRICSGKLFDSDFLPVFFLLSLIILFFYKILFLNKIFCYRDILTCTIPQRYFSRSVFWQRALPLWNPFILCGYPLMVNPAYSVFYPPSLIAYLLPFWASINCYVIIHFFLAAIFMYYLLKEL